MDDIHTTGLVLDFGLYKRDWIWWCTVHNREATDPSNFGRMRCDTILSGILLPCHCERRDVVCE
mgnify:CR=1 FL=1